MATCQETVDLNTAGSTQIVTHEERNVLLIGQTGHGKSTIANMILKSNTFDLNKFDHGNLTPIEPRSAEVQRVINSEEDPVNGASTIKYHITVLDTKGLVDNYRDCEKSRRKSQVSRTDSQSILDEIRKYLTSKRAKDLHLILFVFQYSMDNRLSARDKAIYNLMLNNFQEEAKEISTLVITWCDKVTDDISRNAIVEKFRHGRDTSFIADFMHNSIITVGFPDLEEMEVVSEKLKKSIKHDEEILLQTIYDAHNPKHPLDVMKSHSGPCSLM